MKYLDRKVVEANDCEWKCKTSKVTVRWAQLQYLLSGREYVRELHYHTIPLNPNSYPSILRPFYCWPKVPLANQNAAKYWHGLNRSEALLNLSSCDLKADHVNLAHFQNNAFISHLGCGAASYMIFLLLFLGCLVGIMFFN